MLIIGRLSRNDRGRLISESRPDKKCEEEMRREGRDVLLDEEETPKCRTGIHIYTYTTTTTFPFREEPRFSLRPSSFPHTSSPSFLARLFVPFLLFFLFFFVALLCAKSTRPSLSIITAVAITEGLRFPPYIAATFLF